MGSHRFDLLIDLLGMPTHVWAATATLAHSYEVEDTATVFLRFDNGAQCASTWGWSSQTWIDHLALIGTQGKIILEPVDSPHLTLLVGKGRSQERFDEQLPLPDNVHLPMVQDFVDAVLAGRAPVEQGAEGEKVNRILAAVDESAQSGCSVTAVAALTGRRGSMEIREVKWSALGGVYDQDDIEVALKILNAQVERGAGFFRLPEEPDFEKAFAEHEGCKYASAVNAAGTGLDLAMQLVLSEGEGIVRGAGR